MEEDFHFPEEDKEKWHKGPVKVILGLFMLLLIVLWVVPHYGIKQNPEPGYIPTLKELNIPVMEIPPINSSDIRDYVLVTPEIKQLADKIITLSCLETSRICNAKAIFYFVPCFFRKAEECWKVACNFQKLFNQWHPLPPLHCRFASVWLQPPLQTRCVALPFQKISRAP